MNRIKVGDTVVFRRDVIARCGSEGVARFQGTVTEITGDWLFLTEASGRRKVMPASNMCKVARNGVAFELIAA